MVKNNDNRVGVISASIIAKSTIIAAIISALATALVLIFTEHKSSLPQQTNELGTNIVQFGNSQMTVNNLHGFSKQQYEALLEQTKNFSKDSKIQQNLLQNLLNQLNVDSPIIELKEQIKLTQSRIALLLEDISISDEIKILIKDGDLVEAEKLVDRHYDKEVSKMEATLAASLYEQGKVKELRFKYEEAKKSYEKAAILAPDNANYHRESGEINWMLENNKEAILHFENALTVNLDNMGKVNPAIAIDYNNLGKVFSNEGDLNKAISYYNKALKIDLLNFDESHSSIANDRSNLGGAWRVKGNYDKAIKFLEQALNSDLANFGKSHSIVAIRQNNLGLAWIGKGDYDKAIEYLDLALASDINTYTKYHPSVAIRHKNLGFAWLKKQNIDKARKHYKSSLAVLKATLGDHHPLTNSVEKKLNSIGTKS